MGKYDGLSAFLRRWKLRNDADGVELSFAHIERLIGGYLPNGAADAAWWCAAELADRSAPHRRAWLEAGFEAVADTRSERVYFRRQAEV